MVSNYDDNDVPTYPVVSIASDNPINTFADIYGDPFGVETNLNGDVVSNDEDWFSRIDSIVTEELDSILDLEASLIDSKAALEHLLETGTVAKKDVISFESHFPEEILLNSFTQRPTKTNYDISVITLEDVNWSYVAAIGVAVTALVLKIINWLTNRTERTRNGEMKGKMTEALKEMDTHVTEQKKTGDKDSSGEIEEKITGLTQEFKSVGRWNKLAELCFDKPDQYIKGIFDAKDIVLLETMEVITQLITQYKNLTGSDKDENVEYIVEDMVGALVERVGKKLSSSLGQQFDKTSTSSDFLSMINSITSTRDQLRRERPIKEFYLGVTGAKNTGIAGTIRNFDEHVDRSSRIYKAISNWKKDSEGVEKLARRHKGDLELNKRILKDINNLSLCVGNYLKLIDSLISEERYWTRLVISHSRQILAM